MDDSRRQLTTVLLVFLVMTAALAGMDYFMPPPSPEEAGAEAADTLPGEAHPQEADAAPAPEASPAAAGARLEGERTATIETDEIVATFTNLNTAMTHLRVKGDRFVTEEGEPYEVVTTDREDYLPLRIELGGVQVPEIALWEMEQTSESSIRFRLEADGFEIIREVSAGQGRYQLWSTVSIRNLGSAARPVRITEASSHYVTREEESGGFMGRPSAALSMATCLYGEETIRNTRDDLGSNDDGEPTGEGMGFGPEVSFVAVSNLYFATLMAAESEPAERCRMRAIDVGVPEAVGTVFDVGLRYPRVELAGGETTFARTTIYTGPKDYDALTALGHQATKVVDLGFFSVIAEGLTQLLRWIQALVGNWGLAIILLTVLVKLVLFPLTHKSFSSMAKMRILKPKMDEINERFADDREAKGAAIMELYRKEKINPLGGCLPSLLQLPIWFALYQSLSTNIELYHTPFIGYLTDLSAPDPFYVMPLILGGLMFLQQKLTPTTMDPAQAKMMLYMMPTMITVFMLFLPAGLCLYMVTNTTLGIAQQKYIHWRLDQATPITPEAEEEAPNPEPSSSNEPAKGPSRQKPRSKKRNRRGK